MFEEEIEFKSIVNKSINQEMTLISCQFTRFQVKILINMLKNYKKLRRSHFFTCISGLKQAKITEEVVLVDGLIAYFTIKLEDLP